MALFGGRLLRPFLGPQEIFARFFRVTFWGVLSVTFSGVNRDLHLGNQKVTWKKLVDTFLDIELK